MARTGISSNCLRSSRVSLIRVPGPQQSSMTAGPCSVYMEMRTWSKLLALGESPRAKSVVKEREGPVLSHRNQPQRELGHIYCHGVAVHAVQAPLCDGATSSDDHVGNVVSRTYCRALGTVPSACHASTSRSARYRQAAVIIAPEPTAGSQTRSSRMSLAA